jgi:hypothetical protein
MNPFATVRETFNLVHPNEEFPQKATIFRLKRLKDPRVFAAGNM